MTLFVDTSVWSYSLRSEPTERPEIVELRRALSGGSVVVTTGVVIQKLLQNVRSSASRVELRERLLSLSRVTPTTRDHIKAAELVADCRRRGIPIGDFDALLASVCLRRGLTMLTIDENMIAAAPHLKLQIWAPASGRVTA